MIDRACSAEFATGETTGGTRAMTGKTTGGTRAMTGKTTGETRAMTGKTVVVADLDCSGDRKPDDSAGGQDGAGGGKAVCGPPLFAAGYRSSPATAEDDGTRQPVTARAAVRNPERYQRRNMAWIPGGSFWMGSAGFYPEERPVHRASVDGFWMDEHPVTVEEFRRFVKAAGYVTVAERPLDPADYPDADPALLVPGSLVFHRSAGPVDLRDYSNWWAYVPGASWRHPDGPGSECRGRERHPVTHVAYLDAESYAAWAGKELPTEAEWEYAARGGLDGAVYPWGDEFAPGGQMMANTWQGQFPWQNLLTDGYEGTSPVGSFPANGHGLSDMAGNVWEWTCDYFTPRHTAGAAGACCAPRNPRVSSPASNGMTAGPGSHLPRRVIKGGSHLCAPSYCLRYRPAARQGEAIDTATSHLGFRCVIRGSPPPAR